MKSKWESMTGSLPLIVSPSLGVLTTAYVWGRSGTGSKIGAQDAGRSSRFTGRAADRFLGLILRLRGGDIFTGKSNVASSARKQRSSSY